MKLVNKLKILTIFLLILSISNIVSAANILENADTQKIGGSIVGIIIIYGIIMITRHSRTNRLLYGSSAERRLIKREKLGGLANWLFKAEREEKREVKDLDAGRQAIKADESINKTDPATVSLDKAKEYENQREADETKAEMYTGALEEKTLALDAALMEVVNALSMFANDLESEDNIKQGIEAEMEKEMTKIIQANNSIAGVNAAVTDYIKQIGTSIFELIKNQNNEEKNRYRHLRKALNQILYAIKELKSIENEADGCRKRITNCETREKKDYKTEIRKLRTAIANQLRKLKKQKKEASGPEIEAEIRKQMKLLRILGGVTAELHLKLRCNNDIEEEGLQRIKDIDKNLKDAANYLKNKKKTFNGYINNVEKALKHYMKKINVIEKHVWNMKGDDPFDATSQLLEEIESYSDENRNILSFDNQFRRELNIVIKTGFGLASYFETMIKILDNIEKAEKAYDSAVESVTQLCKVLDDGQGSNLIAQNIVSLKTHLNEQKNIISKSEQINRSLDGYTNEIKRRLLNTSEKLLMLQEEERVLYTELNRLAEQINYILLVLRKRKTDIMQHYAGAAQSQLKMAA